MSGALVGLGLGQANDDTAWAVCEQDAAGMLEARYVERVRGAHYPAAVAHTGALLASLPTNEADLLVDFAGLGRSVADKLLYAGQMVPPTLANAV